MVERGIGEEKMGPMKDAPEVSELRQRAEKELEMAAGSTEAVSEMSPEKMASLIHELQVHQIELKMQNDELRSTRDEFEKARDRYADLYDFAPIGYFTVNQDGLIDEANLTFASMLGVNRSALIRQRFSRFFLSNDQNTYYKHRRKLLETEAPQSLELRLVKKDGRVFYARLESTVITKEEENGKQIRMVVRDITEKKLAEAALSEGREKLEAALKSMTDAVFISDFKGQFIEFNEAFATFHRLGNKSECLKALADWPSILDVYLPDGTLVPLNMWVVNRALRGETETRDAGKKVS